MPGQQVAGSEVQRAVTNRTVERPSHVKPVSAKSKPASEVSHVCCNQP